MFSVKVELGRKKEKQEFISLRSFFLPHFLSFPGAVVAVGGWSVVVVRVPVLFSSQHGSMATKTARARR